jgi:hypothetical protein
VEEEVVEEGAAAAAAVVVVVTLPVFVAVQCRDAVEVKDLIVKEVLSMIIVVTVTTTTSNMVIMSMNMVIIMMKMKMKGVGGKIMMAQTVGRCLTPKTMITVAITPKQISTRHSTWSSSSSSSSGERGGRNS